MSNRTRRLATLQITSTLAPHFGGPAIGALRLRSALEAAGCSARIVSTSLRDDSGQRMAQEECDAIARDAGTNSVVWLEPGPPLALERGKKSFRSILRLIRQADVVHLHGLYRWVHFVSAFALLVFRRPYGIQPHGGLEPYQLRESRYKKWFFDLIVGRRLLRRANYVLFASAEEARRATMIRAEQKVVSPLGAALDEPTHGASCGIFEGRERRDVVVFLGRLARKKNPDKLIRAWAEARRPTQALLVIAGPDSDLMGEGLRALARNLGVSGSVAVIGEVVGGEKSALLAHAGYFVLPSDNENFGVAVAEAMLAGCYCMVSDQVAAKEHVVAAEGGEVVCSTEVSAWSKALEAMLQITEDARSDYGIRNQAYAVASLSWSAVADAVLGRARQTD